MKSSGFRSSRRSQRGQTATEFAVIGIVFFAMLSGLIEATYIYRAKSLLNMAAFEAARTGAMHNAVVAPMETTLEQEMAPLYMSGEPSTTAGVQDATQKATSLYTTMKLFGTPLTIVSPTLQVFNKLSESQEVKIPDVNSSEAVQNVIPNDNLEWRGRQTQNITANGKSATINVQDANLLKIKVYWCQHLLVPGLDILLHEIVDQTGTVTPAQQMCDGVGNSILNYYVAIESDAVVQMQSPVAYVDGNLK